MSTCAAAVASAPRSLPASVTAYDRAVDLRAGEAATLADYVRGLERVGSTLQLWPLTLDRLFRPADELLLVTGAVREVRTGSLRVLGREMHRRQRSYWGWTVEDWRDLLETTADRFAKRHHVSVGCRTHLLALSWLTGRREAWKAAGPIHRLSLARKVFGVEQVTDAAQRMFGVLRRWGYREKGRARMGEALAEALLEQGSGDMNLLTVELLERLRLCGTRHVRVLYYGLSLALAELAVVPNPLEAAAKAPTPARFGYGPVDGGSPEWQQWCERWKDTATLRPRTRNSYYWQLVRVGRWLSQAHPEVTSPAQWTRELAAEYVATIDRLTVGQWVRPRVCDARRIGTPLAASTKAYQLTVLRAFFRDCQEWGWIPRRFDSGRSFPVSRELHAASRPNPRVIADDRWAKLLWAGLNLTEEDLPAFDTKREFYPLPMVRAMALAWFFAGLRSDEIRRLRVSCIRRTTDPGQTNVYLLDVPPNKTGPAYTKPVDRALGEAIAAWEAVRPAQPPWFDYKTGERVHYLFAFRNRRTGPDYLNGHLIPMLCRKAGIPTQDARGRITSHRARATIATQLFNAKEPLSLFELQAWLGHRSPHSTQYYAKLSPTKLAKAYTAADYFARNVRTIQILVDQDAVINGAAGAGQPWKFYDLGHGYCAYEFFDQCPHRMACAKCTFYSPKGSSRAQALEGKANLLHLLQEVPLTEDERAAVEDGVAAFETLLDKLSDVPTPAGPTPRQLTDSGTMQAPVAPTNLPA